ncbi:MAG: DNA translocase FtsK 4TM domain-containing protein [Candidatus Curtissbacteria bacterium]|nr:DNA translocase FtsK 4TM domain-containing protein [Candidatus Curtissbacteria bacterium]
MGRRRRRYQLLGPPIGLERKTIKSIVGVAGLGISAILLLSIVTKSGSLFTLRERYYEIFGLGVYLVPLVIVFASIPLLSLNSRFTKINVIFGFTATVLSLLGLVAPLSPDSSGMLGNILWSVLKSTVTTPGAFLILLFTFFVSVIITVNTSPDVAIKLIMAAFGKILGVLTAIKKKIIPLRKPDFITKSPDDIYRPGKKIIPIGRSREKEEGEPGLSASIVVNSPGQSQIWEYPPLSLLGETHGAQANRGNPKQNAHTIEKTLESFGITAKVIEVNNGPTITQYAIEIPAGTKLSKIMALQNDLALALATPTGNVRIEAPIPGKSLVGIEIPNISPEVVSLKNVLSDERIRSAKSKLTVGLGLDVSGNPVISDIGKMPHVLVAGTTGSGKSVLINAIIATLLFRASPQEVKLILVDPKRVELTDYNDIPHLLTPVIVEPDKILSALRWATTEMDRRYKLFHEAQVRNIQGYNELSGFQVLPYIVIVIDELNDLMQFAPVEIEDAICRIAQMARATGIHLVVATQRPSVDVITGLIKANIPCRIAFNVSSMVDSRVIIDTPGAEKLLGRGDMLYVPPEASKPMRIQGVYVSDTEIRNLISFLKKSGMAPEYTEEVTQMPLGRISGRHGSAGGASGDKDDLFEEAVRTICQYDRASASLLQRRLRVGYARAARLLDELEIAGIVGPGDGSKPRDVLVKNAEEFLQDQNQPQAN